MHTVCWEHFWGTRAAPSHVSARPGAVGAWWPWAHPLVGIPLRPGALVLLQNPPGTSKSKTSLSNISGDTGMVLTVCSGPVETRHMGTSHSSQTPGQKGHPGLGGVSHCWSLSGAERCCDKARREEASLRRASGKSFAVIFLPGQFLVFAFGGRDKSSRTHRFHHSPAVYSSPPNHLSERPGGAKLAPSQHHSSCYCFEGLGRFCFTNPSKTNSGSGRVMGASG